MTSNSFNNLLGSNYSNWYNQYANNTVSASDVLLGMGYYYYYYYVDDSGIFDTSGKRVGISPGSQQWQLGCTPMPGDPEFPEKPKPEPKKAEDMTPEERKAELAKVLKGAKVDP